MNVCRYIGGRNARRARGAPENNSTTIATAPSFAKPQTSSELVFNFSSPSFCGRRKWKPVDPQTLQARNEDTWAL